MLNKVMLIGNLGRDPEIRQSNGGDPIANLSIATSEKWKDKSTGETKERTEWHRVVIFNPHLSKIAGDYLKKGSKVYLEGQLQTRKWTDQSGNEKYTTEVVLGQFDGELRMLDTAGKSGPGFADNPDAYGNTKTAGNVNQQAGGAGEVNDEIPY